MEGKAAVTKSQTWNRWVISVLTVVVAFYAEHVGGESENGKPTEADITRETATLLDREQFSRRPLDAALSSQFLDSYLDALDSAHLLFLQCDLDEFAHFRSDLAQMTVSQGETRAAHVIYERYLKRLAQQVYFETHLLHAAKFDFTGYDSWQIDRSETPRPHDLAAAKGLWLEEVREDYLQEKLADKPAAEIAPLLARRLKRRLNTMRRLNANEVLEIYLDALAHVYDPHSDYFGREEFEDFKIEMDLSLVGVGATLQPKDGYCVIIDIIPGGPAARSGLLKPGDYIVAVAQGAAEPVDIMDMPSPQVVGLLRGPRGSTVRLTIIPAGASDSTRRTVPLVRDQIKLTDDHAKAAIIDLPQSNRPALRIGVIDLPSFYGKDDEKAGGAFADTACLINKLKQEDVAGLILDLRRNGGGSLEEAIWLTGLFIPSGPVVQTEGPEGDVEVDMSPETNALYEGPLVVLTSRLSASASEIVAGALQDYGRALIVGDSSTFGKGTVQTIVPLKEFLHYHGLGAVKLTIRKFYRPSGASTQLKGVIPDIFLPSETDLPDISESKLPNALPWDILPRTTYTNFDLVRPVLVSLRDKSRVRVGVDPGFRLVLEEQAMADKEVAAKSLSLNEVTRRREKAKADDLKGAMNEILIAGRSQIPPTYAITPTKADSPGLPSLRQPARLSTVAKPGENNPDDDIEMLETERILADYIHALRSEPPGASPESGGTAAR